MNPNFRNAALSTLLETIAFAEHCARNGDDTAESLLTAYQVSRTDSALAKLKRHLQQYHQPTSAGIAVALASHRNSTSNMTNKSKYPVRKNPNGRGFHTNRELSRMLDDAEAKVRNLEARLAATSRTKTSTQFRPAKASAPKKTTTTPAAKASASSGRPATPHMDRHADLSGPMASRYYRQHRSDIRAERGAVAEWERQQEQA